jgi:hypothetical protein
METSRPGTPAGSRSSPAARAGGQRAVRLPRHRATSSHPTPRACHGHPARSGCDVAVLAAPLRQRPSTTGVSARVSQRPRRRLGSRLATERDTFPAVLRCDKGLELACRAMADWSSGQVGLHIIPPD